MKKLLLLFTTLTLLFVPFLYGQADSNGGDGKYTIRFQAKENGSIAQALWYDKDWGSHTLTSGMSLDKDTPYFIQTKADEGYIFDHWLINGQEDKTEILDRTITENLEIEAYFKKTEVKYTVSLTTDYYTGTLEGMFYEKDSDGINWKYIFNDTKQIASGTEVTVTATPQPNYSVDRWMVNGKVISPEDPNKYVFKVSENTKIHVTFKQGGSGVPVTFSAAEGGQITKSIVYTGIGPTPFQNGDKLANGLEIELSASSNNGYEIDQWLVNGTADTRYNGETTFKGTINGPTDIKVTFKAVAPSEYPVTFIANEGATVLASYKNAEGKDIYPKSGEKIQKGTSVKFWINIQDDYELEGWFINDVAREELKGKTEFTYTIGSATSVRAQLKNKNAKPVEYPVTFEANEGATVLATYKNAEGKETSLKSGEQVEKGTSVKFSIEIQKDYELEGWLVNNVAREDLKDKTEFTLTIESATNVKAQLKKRNSIGAIATASGVHLFVVDDVLFVEGATTPVEVAIFDAGGVRLFTSLVASRLDLSFLPDGLYFVVAQGQIVKVIK